MLVFAFQSEIWIAQNFNFTIFDDFCLSLSWKYQSSQNVNHAKVQHKIKKYCKFHVDLTRRRLSKSRFKKLGVVPKKLYRTTLTYLNRSNSFFANFVNLNRLAPRKFLKKSKMKLNALLSNRQKIKSSSSTRGFSVSRKKL